MPLHPGKSKAVVSENISEMVHAGHPQNQAVAAALRTARESRNAGGLTKIRAAGVIFEAEDGRVLFVKRNGKSGDQGGKWAFPGGKIEKGETPAEAASRECEEEIGRPAKGLGKPLDHSSSATVDFTTYKCRVPKAFTPELNDEHTDFKWANPDGPPAPLHPGVKATLHKWLYERRADGGTLSRYPEPAQAAQTEPFPHAEHGGEKTHTGPIHSTVAGRTDHLPVEVPSGSYVIPADIVSAMGEGNTNAGFKVLKRTLAGLPYSAKAQPYGHEGGPYGAGSAPYNRDPAKPYGEPLPGHAAGGSANRVKVVVAGGEYTLTPDEVRAVGDGDMDRGHRALDDFVKQYRAHTIKTLQKLPGPKRD